MINQKLLKHKSLMSSFIFYLSVILLLLTINFSITFAANWWDSSYSYRDTINVTTGSEDPSNGYQNYTVQLDYNSSGNLYLDSGDDIRIVYWNGSDNIELDRELLDPNSSTSRIRFRLQENIATSTTTSSYYVYYNNPAAGTPPTNYSNVYLWYDDASVDRESEYVQGRVDNSAHGSGYGNTISWSSAGYYIFDTGDNFVDSLRPSGLNERDIYIEYEHFQTNAYANDMTSGPITRWAGGGAPASETATDMYYYEMGESLIETGSYPTHDDVTRDGRAGSVALADGTLGFFPTATWIRLGLSTWGGGSSVSIKTYYENESGGWGGFRNSGTDTDGSRNTNTGQFGLWLQQDAGRIDNIIARRFVEPEPTTLSFNTTKFNSDISLNFINGTPTSTIFSKQNQTQTLRINVSCSQSFQNSCGEISGFIRYNDTTSSFANISTISGTTPLFSQSTQPQTCILNRGESCTLSWTINTTGQINTNYLLNYNLESNMTTVESLVSDNLTLSITPSRVVAFNQSLYSFPLFEKDSGARITTLEVESVFGNNTNIVVNCLSGNCSTFSTNWTNGIDLNEGENRQVEFTCSDSQSGSFSAQYGVSSDEQSSNSTLDLSCEVSKIFGPISISINNPLANSITQVGANVTFTIEATLNCTATCGEITAYPVLQRSKTGFTSSDPADSSWQLKQDFPFFESGLYWIQSPAMTSAEEMYVDFNFSSTTAWTLIGRGREGWAWTNAGRGTSSDIINDFTSTGAFTPAYYSSTFIDDLLNNSDVSSLNSGVRLRRANETDGSNFQNVIWNFSTLTGWNWNFDSSFALSDYIVNSINYGGTYDTRDANPFDDRRRTFTNAIGAHNNEEGFSYGNSECRGANTPTNYLWEYISECRSIPFTQVYVSPRIQQETPGIISDTTGVNPLYTLSSRAQTCTPLEDGTCSFSWTINTTGAVGSLHNISVIAFSNISSINYSQSSNATINITTIIPPSVTLLTPPNNSKVFPGRTINFSWEINSITLNNTCNLYINNDNVESLPCLSGQTTQLLYNLSTSGLYNWFIEVEDYNNLTTNSSVYNFRSIFPNHKRISKTITSQGSDFYYVNTTFTNFNSTMRNNISIYEFVDDGYSAGSFNPFVSSSSTVLGLYIGDLYNWNFLNISSSQSLSYLISNSMNQTKLLDNFIIGFGENLYNSDSIFDCSSLPGNWINVPANSYFNTPNFCVMQFEAKDVGGIATSQPSLSPWTLINFTDARAECNQLNSVHGNFSGNFRMITNREWMTLARNAEQQNTNWNSSVVGNGSMFRGHTDGSPLSRLAVSNTGDYYDGTGNSAPSIEKRVLELSNADVVWDLGGNVWEWVDMLEDGSTFNGNSCLGIDGWYSYFGNDGSTECSFILPFSKNNSIDTRYEMGPLGDYNANNGIGRIYSDGASGRVSFRGGRTGSNTNAGIFSVFLGDEPSGPNTWTGFRCTYEP